MHLVGFHYKIFITMHGPLNVKFCIDLYPSVSDGVHMVDRTIP